MRLNQDFKEFLIALNKHGVRYLVLGGYAVIHYGYNRTTGDLDVWVERTESNYKLLMQAFSEFGLPAIPEEMFLSTKTDVYTFGVPPVCLEILTAARGLDFAACFSNAPKVNLDGVPAHLIHLDDLVRNKKAVGRNKDLDDLEHLNLSGHP